MKILGLIVEYNPFTKGHLHHIQEAKKLINPDYTIAIMSGNFVQRGQPAIINKFDRASQAIKYGVDLVIELPFVYASQSADYFAFGAIDLLNAIGVSDIVFGSESNNVAELINIATTIKTNKTSYNKLIKEFMHKGYRYPNACNEALKILTNSSITNPNDLLGLSYVKEIILRDLKINIHTIQRTNDFHGLKLTHNASASAIRYNLENNKDITSYLLDPNIYNRLIFFKDYFPFIKYQLLVSDIKELNTYHLVDEGIEYKLLKEIKKAESLDEYINKLTSKRYTQARIQRIIVNILLKNTKESIKLALNNPYLRVLKMNKKGSIFIKNYSDNFKYPLILKVVDNLNPCLDLELKTSRFLSIIHPELLIQEYNNIPYIK